VVKDNLTNTAYTFGHAGHMAGTVESGSRDDTWNVQSMSEALHTAWNNFGAGFTWHWEADVNVDFNSVVDKAIAGAGLVLAVVAVA
jgi:hypothetical protein